MSLLTYQARTLQKIVNQKEDCSKCQCGQCCESALDTKTHMSHKIQQKSQTHREVAPYHYGLFILYYVTDILLIIALLYKILNSLPYRDPCASTVADRLLGQWVRK